MLSLTAQHKLLKALKVPDAQIARVLAAGEHEIELPQVFVFTPMEFKEKRERWKRDNRQSEKRHATKGAMA